MTRRRPVAVSLFSGIGGLDSGIEAAGFEIRACVEMDDVARRTLRELHPKWPLLDHGDVCTLSGTELLGAIGLRRGELDLLVGGPPCQPFSRARAWAGPPPGRKDVRARTLAAFFRIAAETTPRVFLLENVPGLASSADQYLRRKVNQLSRRTNKNYSIAFVELQAADFGVPQRRKRLFLVGVRDGRPFAPPSATHAEVADPVRGIERYRTAWDAIGHLDRDISPRELACTGQWARLLPSIPEGKNYLHHTPRGSGISLFGWRTRFWSFLLKLAKSEPSWTLSATPGPATGPFHWKNRRLSIREMAALQTIPLEREPNVSVLDARRLFGNAVPSVLGETLGLQIRREVFGERHVRKRARLVPAARTDTPPPETTGPVPPDYWGRQKEWLPHPGPGLGPGSSPARGRSPRAGSSLDAELNSTASRSAR